MSKHVAVLKEYKSLVVSMVVALQSISLFSVRTENFFKCCVHSHNYSAFVMRTIPLFLLIVCVFLVQICSWVVRYL